MIQVFHIRLVCLVLLAGMTAPVSAEPLRPAVLPESECRPLITPTNAQISGPLDGEDLEKSWDQNRVDNLLPPTLNPDEVFDEFSELQQGSLPGATVESQRPFIDSSLTTSWLTPIDGFGVSEVDMKSTLLLPIFYEGSPIRLAMGFATTFMDTPIGIDVPSTLYGIQAEPRWLIALRENLAVDLGVGAGIFSDLNSGGVDGFRVTGRAILVKTVSEQLKLSAGFLYLGRENLRAMPVAGLIYTPQDDVRIELLIPRSRLARRMFYTGTREHWFYAGVELFGGNSWATEKPDGSKEVVVYRDNRLIFGYETKAERNLAGRIETGYVFGRNLTVGDDPTLSPGGTMMMRLGITY